MNWLCLRAVRVSHARRRDVVALTRWIRAAAAANIEPEDVWLVQPPSGYQTVLAHVIAGGAHHCVARVIVMRACGVRIGFAVLGRTQSPAGHQTLELLAWGAPGRGQRLSRALLDALCFDDRRHRASRNANDNRLYSPASAGSNADRYSLVARTEPDALFLHEMLRMHGFSFINSQRHTGLVWHFRGDTGQGGALAEDLR